MRLATFSLLSILVGGGCTFDGSGPPGAPGEDGPGQQPGAADDSDEVAASPEGGSEPDLGLDPDSDPDPKQGEESCEELWVDLLANPGFDDGAVAWEQSSVFEIITDNGPLDAHSPSLTAWFGGYAFAEDRLTQRVQVPLDARALRVRTQLAKHVPLLEASDNQLALELLDDEGAPLETLIEVRAEDLSSSWERFELEASETYAGESIAIDFFATSELSHVSFVADSVALEALVCD